MTRLTNDDCEFLGKAMGTIVKPELKKLEDRLAALEESKLGVRDVGTWTAAEATPRAMSPLTEVLWTALHDFPGKPGGGPSSGWRLSQKRPGAKAVK